MGNAEVSRGLLIAAQGINSIGDGLNQRDQIAIRKRELEMKEVAFKQDNAKFELAQKQAALWETGQLSSQYNMYMQENPATAKQFVELPETKAKMADLAPKLGLSPERFAMTFKNENEFFRVRRDMNTGMLNNYASTIQGDAPEIAASVKNVAAAVSKTTDPTQLKTLMDDNKDLLTSAFSFKKLRDQERDVPGSIPINTFHGSYNETTSDDPNATRIMIKGGGVKYGVPKGKELSTDSAKDIESGVLRDLGVKDFQIKLRPQNMQHVFDDASDIAVSAEQILKQSNGALGPLEARKQAVDAYRLQKSEADKKLGLILNDSDGKKFIQNNLKTTDIGKVPLRSKLEFLKTFEGAQSQGK